MNKKLLLLLLSIATIHIAYSADADLEAELAKFLDGARSKAEESDDLVNAELANIEQSVSRVFSSLSVSDDSRDTPFEKFQEKKAGRYSGFTTSLEKAEQRERRKKLKEKWESEHGKRMSMDPRVGRPLSPLQRKRSSSGTPPPTISKRPTTEGQNASRCPVPLELPPTDGMTVE